jgi:hypothetical protein
MLNYRRILPQSVHLHKGPVIHHCILSRRKGIFVDIQKIMDDVERRM